MITYFSHFWCEFIASDLYFKSLLKEVATLLHTNFCLPERIPFPLRCQSKYWKVDRQKDEQIWKEFSSSI